MPDDNPAKLWAAALRRAQVKADYTDDHKILAALADAYEYAAKKRDDEIAQQQPDEPAEPEVHWNGPSVPDPTVTVQPLLDKIAALEDENAKLRGAQHNDEEPTTQPEQH